MPEISTEPTYSDRGFARWEPVDSTYGAKTSVYESSAAEAPHLWVSIDGEAHVSGEVRPFASAAANGLVRGTAAGSIHAHLTMDQARELHRRLGAAIEHSETRFGGAPDA